MVAAVESSIKRAGTIPIGVRLRAQNLYINRGFTPKQISEVVGLTSQQIASLAVRGGWTKTRNDRTRSITQRVESRTQAGVDAVAETIGAECDEYALGSLKRIGESLERTDPNAARDFQAYSVGLKNVVAVARTVRGLDTAQAAAPSVNIAFFMGQLQPAEPTNVTPAIELRP